MAEIWTFMLDEQSLFLCNGNVILSVLDTLENSFRNPIFEKNRISIQINIFTNLISVQYIKKVQKLPVSSIFGTPITIIMTLKTKLTLILIPLVVIPITLMGKLSYDYAASAGFVPGQFIITLFIIAALISIIVTLILLFLTLKYLVINPIKVLADASRKINTANLDIQLPTRSHDEIGTLYTCFNKMVTGLQAALQEIEYVNTELEEKVRQRTLNLQQVNMELENARQKADAANRAKSEFVGNISHELRTPMNGILGMAQLVLNSPLNEKQRKQVNILYDSGKILLNIINELLDLGKIEAGKMELEAIPSDLLQTIKDAVNLLNVRAEEKGLNLAIQTQGHLPQQVIGDHNRLRQIILNLVGNAVKFTQKGNITVLLALEKIIDNQAQLKISVIDTGIGISPQELPLMFDKFHQANASTSRKYGGTGLGLFICRQLIELMGGKINVESQEGKGSTFYFTLILPIVPSTPVSEMTPQIPSLAAKVSTPTQESISALPNSKLPPRILLAEDDRVNQIVAKMTLADINCQLDIANHGQEALDMIAKQTYDLVLMDLHMPILDGYATTQRIRQSEQNTDTHLPIIAMTADLLSGDLENCLEACMDDTLVKPITKVSIEEILNKWLPTKALPAKTTTAHILVVEDNETNQLMEKMMLEGMGYQVKIANDGQQAVDLTANTHYDLVLMDIHMPVLDGCTATSYIRQREKHTFTHLPIIAITASATVEDIEKCTEAGMDDFLSKPIAQSALAQILKKWLNTDG